MKAGFSLSKRFVPAWRGNDKLNTADQLVAEFKMPTVDDLFAMIDVLQRAGATDSANVSMERSRVIAKEAGQYVPKYVTLINAEDFNVQDIITYPPYFSLAVELLFNLLAFAQPNEEETKNS